MIPDPSSAGRSRAVDVPAWARRFAASLSTAGLLVGTAFFAASLTPSLLPRTVAMQGLLSGLSLAAGYALGVAGRGVWLYLELPRPRARTQRIATALASVVCISAAVVFLWQMADGQSSVRVLMGMEPVDTGHPFRVAALAIAAFLGLLGLGRLFGLTARFATRKLGRFVPRRVAAVVGTALAALAFWSVLDGVLIRMAMRASDASFRRLDALIQDEIEPPDDPMKTGSAASKVAWQELGRKGRAFTASGPNREAIAEFFGEGALEPIRVYVGLRCAESPSERARLALEELRRVGAFDRSVLLVATPTGTGWVDANAVGPLEHLLGGDVASVAVQYSYLPSWLSLLSEPEYGAETARAVFAEIYGYWTTLPRDRRPRLYLHGLSLGALHSERAADLYDVIGDPFSGAVWSGPPFRSVFWRAATAERRPDSPVWRPRFRDGSIVRFTNQENALEIPGASWGPMRLVYLQYASDPVTFFEWEALWRPPAWLKSPRGPDVSPKLRWYPVVTMLQLLVDIAAAHATPVGYGHVYAPEHYLDGWRAVVDPPGWTPERFDRLRAHLREGHGNSRE